jgi:hypothetical protein
MISDSLRKNIELYNSSREFFWDTPTQKEFREEFQKEFGEGFGSSPHCWNRAIKRFTQII